MCMPWVRTQNCESPQQVWRMVKQLLSRHVCGGEGDWELVRRGEQTVTSLERCNNQFGLCTRTKRERWVAGFFGSGWTWQMLFRKTAGTGLRGDWMGEEAAGGGIRKPQLVRMEGQTNRGDGGTHSCVLFIQNKNYPWTIMLLCGLKVESLLVSSFHCKVEVSSFMWNLSHLEGCPSLACVRLFVTPWTTCSCQAPLSRGFSRQKYWRELPFPSLGDLPYPGTEPRSLTSLI